MDYEIVWTEPATADLEGIVTYLAEHSPKAAERVANAILGRVEQLKVVPLVGAAYPPGSTGKVRKIVSGKYRIFYRVHEDRQLAEVLAVWHSSRSDPELPE
jgi:plasmid stabilization system protein ParE